MSGLVIVQHDQTDSVAADAISHLGSLVVDGLADPFWQIHPHAIAGRALPATYWSADGPDDHDLLVALAGVETVSRLRLVTVATDAIDPTSIAGLSAVATEVDTVLTETRPRDIPMTDVRIIAPRHLDGHSALTELFSHLAAANLVLFPEDRISDNGFALPMSDADPERFAAHVAVEVATQSGLWHDMASAPVDTVEPGVMGGDIRVWVTRSYARLAVAPPLPVEEAIAASEVLPAPPGLEPAPLPHQTAGDFASGLFSRIDELHFRDPGPAPISPTRMSIPQAAKRMAREAGTYVRNLPCQLRHGAVADLQYVSGEALDTALGSSSAVQVIWDGKISDDHGNTPPPIDLDTLRQRLLQRLGRPESASFDQNLWSAMVDDIFAMVDGGVTSEHTAPPAIGHDRVAVLDPRAVTPDPADGIAATVEEINAEELAATSPTAVGRISAHLRDQIDTADRFVDTTVTDITEQLRRLRGRRFRGLSVLAWLTGCTIAALIAAIVVFTGLAEAAGLTSWGPDTRLRLAQVGLVVIVATLATLLTAGLNGGRRRNALLIEAAVLAVGIGASSATWSTFGQLPEPIGRTRIGEIWLLLTVVALIGVALVFLCTAHTTASRAAARLTGILAVTVATVMAVITVVRPDGWIATTDPGDVASARARWITTLTTILIALLITSIALRVRERLTIDDTATRIRWAAHAAENAVAERARLAQAVRQWHGSAAAIARTVWSPFGDARPSADTDTNEVALAEQAHKLQIHHHRPHDDDLLGVKSRIRHEVAAPGWLTRQYRVAVDMFQPEYAYRTGRVAQPGLVRRPECDPVPENPHLDAATAGTGIRWTFADMLYHGAFDDALRAVGSDVALDAVLEMYFDDHGPNLGRHSDLADFSDALVAGRPRTLPMQVLDHTELAIPGDPRTEFASTVWWPNSIERPHTDRPVTFEPTRVSTDSPNQLVVAFVRSDWSTARPLGTRRGFEDKQPTWSEEPDQQSARGSINSRDLVEEVM